MALPQATPLIANQIDSLKTLTDGLCESHQVLSGKIDSMHYLASDILMAQSNSAKEIDSISMQLKAISEYGIGFSDAASHIALPLIIALFAFAFPFLFTVKSHINNKYKAESITKMLSSEASYGWFMGGAIFCASFLFVTGLMSICLKGDSNSTFKVVLNWSSVFFGRCLFCYNYLVCLYVYKIQSTKKSVGKNRKPI